MLALKPSTEAGAAGVTHEDLMIEVMALHQKMEGGAEWRGNVETALKDLHEGQNAIREEFSPVLKGMTEIKSMIEGAQFIKTGTRYAKWIGVISAALAAILAAVVAVAKVTAAAFARAVL
jgi:hypothetical protein